MYDRKKMVEKLTKLFNKIKNKGYKLMPLFKKQEKTISSNYRGIILLALQWNYILTY